MKKTLLTILLAFVMLFVGIGTVGCGGGVSPHTVVVFSEYNGAIGAEDNAVKEAIEKKFTEDTGLELDLQVEAVGTDMVGSKIVAAMGDSSSAIDGFVCHYGSDSPINNYILDGLTMDLTDLVKANAPSYVASFDEDDPADMLAFNRGKMDGKLYALSGKTRTSGWGMLIRKDYMEQTSFDPDEYDILNENYKSLTIGQFKQLLQELKDNTACERPIVGRPWSLDYFLTSPFGAVGYGEKVLLDGQIVPAYADESYLKVMELYRWLQEEKLWIENPSNAQNVMNYFVSGKGAVYMDWPEVTSQVDVARSLKEATGADCIMLAPLLTEGSETETNGNSRIPSAFSGLAVPLKSKNYELLLKYIEWLYSDVENYELAQYGIEGRHWVATTEENGQPGWDYPSDKKAQYETNPPYSGKYCLVEDYTLSDRLYADYTASERGWIEKARSFPSYPADGYVTEGMLLPGIPATDRQLRNMDTAHYDEYISVRAYAWSDAALPEGKTIASMWQEMHDNLFGKYYALIEYHTANYNKVAGIQ